MSVTTIIGVDCATKPNKVGVARARLVDGAWRLIDAQICSTSESPSAHIRRWISEDADALLALDAPLGWPRDLPVALRHHQAGTAVEADPHTLFNRSTDRFVFNTLRQRPLDVGADRIARTAFAALAMLEEVRDATGLPLPLAWSANPKERPTAIEVYPAATLKAHGLQVAGYKKHESGQARRDIEALVESRLENDVGFDVATGKDDVLDAILCVIAGLDFLAGDVHPPVEVALARREGWIWVYRSRARLPIAWTSQTSC